MFLNYACYFGEPQEHLESVVDFVLDQCKEDGGFNCRKNRSGARHSPLHSTLSVLEGILEYSQNGYVYRVGELEGAASDSREFILRHRLFRSDHTGEVIRRDFLKLSFPPRWKYNILRSLAYFGASGAPWDERMRDALGVLLAKRRADGRWSLREYFAGPSFISDRSPNETRVYARPEGPEGEKLELDVYEASGRGTESAARSGSRPAVIRVHGGFFQFGRRSDKPRWDAWLADEGYVVFDIDYRLAPPPRWKDAPGDVKCAVGWVKENAEGYGVDPDRIALMGDSAGGHLSLLAAYTEDDPRLPPSCETGDTSVAAVVGFFPPTDLTSLCADVDGECALRPFTGATPATNPDRYRLVSPVSHVDSSDPSTFLVQGGRDSFVPPGQSRLLARRLEEVGVEHRLLELPYAQHGFDLSWGGWGSQITRPELERFLEQHLGRQSPKTQ